MMSQRVQHILDALTLLAVHEPRAHARIVTEAREIVFAPNACSPMAIACAGGWYGRRIMFRHDPMRMDVVELAATIFHESLHLATDPFGRLITIPHECMNCRNFVERVRDAIYRAEAALEARLRAATGIRKRPSTEVGDFVGAVVIGGLLGIGIGAVASSLGDRA